MEEMKDFVSDIPLETIIKNSVIVSKIRLTLDRDVRSSKDLALDKLCNCNYLSPDEQRQLDRLNVRVQLLKEILGE